MIGNDRSRPRGVAMMAIAGVCFFALMITLVVSGQLFQAETATAWAGPIGIETDSEHDAGQALTVIVSAAAPEGTPVQLAVFAPFSATLLEQTLSGGETTFTIAGPLLEHAGLYQLVAQLDQSSQTHQLRILPGEPVDPVVPLVGPRTIIADGVDITMTVVTPIDEFGSPVANGTEVDIDILRPNGDRSTIVQPVDQGIAAVIVAATTETGRATIAATAGDAGGPSNVVDQVAGTPGPFTIVADVRNALADGFTLHQVQTSELRDGFGNLLPDGVAVVFVVSDNEHTSLIDASVQGGIARAVIAAPDAPGELTLLARVSGAQSAPAVFAFLPAVTSVPASLAAVDDAAILSVGPVLTARGGYVPDGTLVIVREQSSGATVASAALRGGTAELQVDNLGGPLDVLVLGASTTVEAEDS